MSNMKDEYDINRVSYQKNAYELWSEICVYIENSDIKVTKEFKKLMNKFQDSFLDKKIIEFMLGIKNESEVI